MRTKYLNYVSEQVARKPILAAFQNSGSVKNFNNYSPASLSLLANAATYNNPYPISTMSALPTMQDGDMVSSKNDDEYTNYIKKLIQYVEEYGEEELAKYPEQYSDYLKFSDQMSSYDSAELTIKSKKNKKSETNDTLSSFIRGEDNDYSKFPIEDYTDSVMSYIDQVTKILSTNDYSPTTLRETKMSFNLSQPKELEPMGIFKEGGSVTSPSYSRYLPVGNSKKITGYLPMDSLIPIQTEEGELIVHPTLDVTKVNATKRHSRMKDDEVTDIVPEGSYILSRHGVVRIYKDEANKKVIETKNSPYNIHATNKPPTVKTLGDFMTKKEMSPAEVANNVLKKYKTVNHNDPFTDQTNNSNKYAASKYIRAIVDLSEFDKSRKGIAGGQDMSQMYQSSPEMSVKNGGNIYRRPNVSRHPIGELIGQILGTGASLYTNWQNRKIQDKLRKEGQAAIDTGYQDINRLSGLKMAPLLAYTAAADPTQEYRNLQDYSEGLLPLINSMQSRNAFASQMASTAPDFSMYSPQDASALLQRSYADRLNALSKYSQGEADRRAGLYTDYLKSKSDIVNKNILGRTAAANVTRDRINALLGQSSEVASGYFLDLMKNMQNKQALEAALRGQNAAAQAQFNTNLGQIFSSKLPTLGESIDDYMSSQNTGGQTQNLTTQQQEQLMKSYLQTPEGKRMLQIGLGMTGFPG